MNDFMKEELLTLYNMCCANCDYIIRDVSKLSQTEGTELIREFYVGMLKQLHDIRIKIQSLIDNYCDHKNIGSISDIDYLNICKDCHEIQGWA